MAYVIQKGKTDCGVACLAMLCDVEYEDAMRAIPWKRAGLLDGTTTKQIREGAEKIGMYTTYDRLRPLREKTWEDIPDNSLVKIINPNDERRWHWVVWRKNKIYDPAVGVFKPKKFYAEPVSFMQFLRS